MLKYQDIFVPGGFPQHTYNPRAQLNLEERIEEAKNNLCKLVTVTGHTKSGKTILVSKVLPRQDSIWIDGGAVSSEDDFWHIILDELELFQTVSNGEADETNESLSGEVSGGLNVAFAKGGGRISGTTGSARNSAIQRTRAVSSRVAALRGLREQKVPLVVDDFHYLPKQLQGSVIRALKPLIFEGLPVVIIAIPHRRYDAMKVEREMTGRILSIEIPTWDAEELEFIPRTGFALLKYNCDDTMSARLADEAIGSPHLMQDFCRGICRSRNIEPAQTYIRLQLDANEIRTIYKDVADSIGRPIFEKLARGPRQRTDRVPRELADGGIVDIYQLILHAMARMRPDLESLEYEDLRAAIRDVSADQKIPQLQEVARVLKHMSEVAAKDESSTPVIDFDESERVLHVTDPFFAFFLRWGNLD